MLAIATRLSSSTVPGAALDSLWREREVAPRSLARLVSSSEVSFAIWVQNSFGIIFSQSHPTISPLLRGHFSWNGVLTRDA